MNIKIKTTNSEWNVEQINGREAETVTFIKRSLLYFGLPVAGFRPRHLNRWAFLVVVNRLRIKFKFIVIVLFTFLALSCGAKSAKYPEAALAEFYVYDGMEEQLMDPLIRAGDGVVPLVIEKVKDKNMPRRRYAIGFLGNGSHQQALPVLKQILQDESEVEYFRGDALTAIYRIDEPLGIDYAKRYQTKNDYVGLIANEILAQKAWLKNRRNTWLSLCCF